MAVKSADQVAQKWAQNLTNSVQSIKNGVQAVTTSPMEAAAAQAQQYAQGVQQAINSGKWQAGLRRVSLGQWQQAVLSKGLSRIADGASQAKGKVQAVMQQLLPHIQAGVAALPPRGSKQQNQQRMLAFSEHMSQFQRGS